MTRNNLFPHRRVSIIGQVLDDPIDIAHGFWAQQLRHNSRHLPQTITYCQCHTCSTALICRQFGDQLPVRAGTFSPAYIGTSKPPKYHVIWANVSPLAPNSSLMPMAYYISLTNNKRSEKPTHIQPAVFNQEPATCSTLPAATFSANRSCRSFWPWAAEAPHN